jgi:hypothetical protein
MFEPTSTDGVSQVHNYREYQNQGVDYGVRSGFNLSSAFAFRNQIIRDF